MTFAFRSEQDTLAVVGNRTAFARAVRWIGANVDFDIDLRVNVFETNIRLLGGLLSAHLLAMDSVRLSFHFCGSRVAHAFFF